MKFFSAETTRPKKSLWNLILPISTILKFMDKTTLILNVQMFDYLFIWLFCMFLCFEISKPTCSLKQSHFAKTLHLFLETIYYLPSGLVHIPFCTQRNRIFKHTYNNLRSGCLLGQLTHDLILVVSLTIHGY